MLSDAEPHRASHIKIPRSVQCRFVPQQSLTALLSPPQAQTSVLDRIAQHVLPEHEVVIRALLCGT